MAKDLTFESACQVVKGEYPELANDIDSFSSIVLAAGTAAAAVPIATAIGPTIVTPAAIILTAIGTLSNIFGVKNEISTISENIIAKIAGKRDKDTLKLFERMQQAFSLTCYTSFFEALNRHEYLSPLLEKIKVTGEEKRHIAVEAAKELLGRVDMQAADTEMGYVKFEIDLPQPGDTFQMQCSRLLPLYQQLAKRVENFFELETIKKQVQESGGQEKVEKALKEVPEKAIEYFKAQYYGLAMKYPEFATWLNLQENEKNRIQLQEVAEYNRKLLDQVENGQKTIDIGFRHMEEIVKSIPLQTEQKRTDIVLQRLETWYTNTINKPIIDDPYSEYSYPTLKYPKKSEIFVPQAFQVLHYTGEQRLEREQTWKGLPERDDLSAFLLSYFNHPICVHKPLIILGQPGSGKSLLTSMLAARLVTTTSLYTPIRVELRHVNPEASISVQVKDQIYKDTTIERSWGELANCLINQPPLLLFDGYDELLQATGKTFLGYLKDIEAFQEDELTRGQTTVRTVVTSRINLIDKANIPLNATIIRLLKFNIQRQNKWISLWNNTNSTYFEQAQVQPFVLPQNNESINQLAEQPLLLMMLAIYDSVRNPLLHTKNLDQTLLYDELLRRFIERELKKDEKTSRSWQKGELNKAIDHEMKRLGVAAIGMFNRRKLYIRQEELDADLKFFDLKSSSLETGDRRLSLAGGPDLLPAEKMFGSFFFQQLTAVHKSTGPASIELATVYKPQEKESDIAYEFLHNTFGEFLAADFILRKIFEETAVIHRLTGDKILRNALSQRIEQPDGLGPEWFARFMYAPLFSRPVIVDLLREWSRHLLQREQRGVEEVLTDLDPIVTSHINLLLAGNALPTLMTSNQRPFSNLPIIGHLAIYTLNLILLRALLAPDSFTFDETKYTPSEDGTRVWDRLTYLWRSWFSLETLNELAAILITERDGTKIHLQIKKAASISSNRNRLELIHSVGQALADNIISGLSGLLLYDAFRTDKAGLVTIHSSLRSEQLSEPLTMNLFTKQLRLLRKEKSISATELDTISQGLGYDLHDIDQRAVQPRLWSPNFESSVSLVTETIRLVQRTNDPNFLRICQKLVARPEAAKLADEIAEEAIKLARETNFSSALHYFGTTYLREAIERKKLSTTLLTELIKVAEVSSAQVLSQYIKQEYLGSIQDNQEHLPPLLVVQMIKFARAVGDQVILDYFSREYIKGLLKAQGQITIELAAEMVKLARETGDQEILSQLITKCITLIRGSIGPRKTIVEEFATLLVDLLRAACEMDNWQIPKILVTYVRAMIDQEDNYVLPDLTAAILKFARKINDQKIIGILCQHLLPAMLQVQEQVPVKLAVELIKLAQEQKPYYQETVESYYYKNIMVERCHFESLPLDTIIDIHHLAITFGDNKLAQQIDAILRL